jgi:hypothetical protein
MSVSIIPFMKSSIQVIDSCIGEPKRPVSTRDTGQLANGRMLVRMPVDLQKMLRYLELKREESGTYYYHLKAVLLVYSFMECVSNRVSHNITSFGDKERSAERQGVPQYEWSCSLGLFL